MQCHVHIVLDDVFLLWTGEFVGAKAVPPVEHAVELVLVLWVRLRVYLDGELLHIAMKTYGFALSDANVAWKLHVITATCVGPLGANILFPFFPNDCILLLFCL